MKPLIGITSSAAMIHQRTYNKTTTYYDHSVEIAGGVPLLIPILQDHAMAVEIAARLDGIIISGGDDDIDPACYGETPCQQVCQISPIRDAWEFALYRQFKQAGKPILGICRGCQVINVFEGGDLYQSLCTQISNCRNHYTRDKLMYELDHDITIVAGSQLHHIFETDILTTNSFHNQAVKHVAPGFRASAFSEDGIIEAIESETAPFIVGVQAHPEALTDAYPHFIKLFEALITAAKPVTTQSNFS